MLAATDLVLPGIEVIDSRYRDFKFDLKSVVADNTSAARFVVGGQAIRPEQVDLRTVGVVLEKNGEPVALGAGAAVLGHPRRRHCHAGQPPGPPWPGNPRRQPDFVGRRDRGRGREGGATTSHCACKAWAAWACVLPRHSPLLTPSSGEKTCLLPRFT